MNANGQNLRSLHSQYIAKLRQIAVNATARGEHDKASRFNTLAQQYSEVI